MDEYYEIAERIIRVANAPPLIDAIAQALRDTRRAALEEAARLCETSARQWQDSAESAHLATARWESLAAALEAEALARAIREMAV